MRAAGGCNACFAEPSQFGVIRAATGRPQVRWLGEHYATSDARVTIVLINPGAAIKSGKLAEEIAALSAFYDGGDYRGVRTFFQKDIATGAKWIAWYSRVLGLDLDRSALINIAWCATFSNRYPRAMLTQCFKTHTAKLLSTLQPRFVLLSGSATHSFARSIAEHLDTAVTIIPSLHFAHRRGHLFEQAEAARLRTVLPLTAFHSFS